MPVSAPLPPATAPTPWDHQRRTGSAAERVFLELLDRRVENAAIRFTIRGDPVSVGRGAVGPAIHVHDDRFFGRVLSAGNLGLAESYMDGDWDVEEGDIAGFLTVLLRARLDREVKGNLATAARVLAIQMGNLVRRRHWKNAQVHYDIGDDLYQSFLDRDWMMYSCGYANDPNDSIEQLQAQKLDRICRKLEMRSGDRVLDIGCGFGGMLMYAATYYGVSGVGITTSRRHCEFGNKRIAAAGLGDRIRLEWRDHRTIEGRFDRVVSIGMMEHLPRAEYGRYFQRISSVLPPHGTGLVHVIGCNAPRNVHDPFTQKYIFPGSGTPKLSELADGCERNGLAVRDVENIVRHYDYTSTRWLERFRGNKRRLDSGTYDARFQRMWEYYLSCAIAGARASDSALYQILFMKDYAAPMPLHRV